MSDCDLNSSAPKQPAMDLATVITYLQQEFRSFEIERNQWRAEKSGLLVCLMAGTLFGCALVALHYPTGESGHSGGRKEGAGGFEARFAEKDQDAGACFEARAVRISCI